ncbi:MAG: 30S ribosomal protein S16 [Candidatus Gracilibacteria bacterium]|nr:30S ribosomal protein S16 [Candidatus Gracilibacteria bacterium]
MLKIRLSRSGRKHVPFFHIVLTEHKQSAKHGYIKVLGFYNPITKELKFDEKDAAPYIANGAQYSETLAKVLAKSKK